MQERGPSQEINGAILRAFDFMPLPSANGGPYLTFFVIFLVQMVRTKLKYFHQFLMNFQKFPRSYTLRRGSDH